MTSPYAAGLGGFMNGFAGGMKIGEQLRTRFAEAEAQKEREAAVEDGRRQYQEQVAQQQKAIDGVVEQQGVPGGNGTTVTPVQERQVAAENLPPVDGGQPVQQGAPVELPPPGQAPAQAQQQAAPQAPPQVAPPQAPPPVAAQGLPPMQGQTERVIETPGIDPEGKRRSDAQTLQLAKVAAGSERDAIDKAISSRMRNFYMDRGEIELADKWDKYAEGQQGKKQIKAFAGALKAYSAGNMQGFVESMIPVLKDSYGEGFAIQNYEPVKTKEGETTGYNFSIRNTRTGEVTQNSVPIGQLVQVGMSLGSPEAIHKRFIDAEQAKAKGASEAMAKRGEMDLKHRQSVDLERVRQGGQVALEGVKSQTQAQRDADLHEKNLERDSYKGKIDSANQKNRVQQELDAKVGALTKAGYSEEFIKGALPDILGVNQHKKSTSPEEAKRLAHSDRIKNDMSYSRKTADEQRKILEQDMALIYGGMKPSDAPAGAKPGAGEAAPGPAARGLPVLDKKTGEIVYR